MFPAQVLDVGPGLGVFQRRSDLLLGMAFSSMGLLLSPHHRTEGLPRQRSSFPGEGEPVPHRLGYHATNGFMLPQSLKELYQTTIGSLFSEIRQECQDVAHRNHAD
jgi:hypothetical protein